jgi:hypothetical protein
LWQGLKVFEREDSDPDKWAITNIPACSGGRKKARGPSVTGISLGRRLTDR